jgi:hypothetical protein
MAAEELNKDGHSASLDDDLGLLGRPRRDVGERPSCLELHKGMWRPEKLNEATHNAGLDHSLNRGVTLLGEEFPELGCSLDLLVDLFGKDTLHHLGEILIELYTVRQYGSSQKKRYGVCRDERGVLGGTHLAFDVTTLVIAVWGCTERSTRLIPSGNATALREVLLTFGAANLDLLLFAAATELVRLEGGLRLESVAAMLWDVPIRHG